MQKHLSEKFLTQRWREAHLILALATSYVLFAFETFHIFFIIAHLATDISEKAKYDVKDKQVVS